jgi:hypothetical protein
MKTLRLFLASTIKAGIDMSEPIVEITSDDLLWIDFKGKEIRIEQNPNFNDGKLMITVHKPNQDFHAKLLVKEESDE